MNRQARRAVVWSSTVLAVLIVIGGVLGKTLPSDGAYRQLAVYSEVLSKIRSDYVQEPDLNSVTKGALHGLLESLDPSSSYLSPEEYLKYQRRQASGNGSLGLIVSKKFGYAAIVSVIRGAPAARAGLQSGDIIEGLNDTSTRGMSLEEITRTLAGEPGTVVSLSAVRVRRGKPQRMALQREEVTLPSVTYKTLEPGIGYLQVEGFRKGESSEIASHARQLIRSGARRLVLDLRGAAQGEVSEGIAVANLFLDHGVITYLEGQKYPRQTFTAEPSEALLKLPVVVLVNRATAGAAEVVASAILENGRGDVVGEKTYGVGSVQRVIPLDDGAALILSVAKYHTPGGKAIENHGVTPSVVVTDALLEEPRWLDEERKPEQEPTPEDTVLKRALEVLKNQTQKPRLKEAA